MDFWNVERDWEGETCAIMASGPSMTYELSESIRRLGVRTIAVNNQGIKIGSKEAMAPWADLLYAADQLWWSNNRAAALEFAGVKVTIAPSSGGLKREGEQVHIMGNGGPVGFDVRTTHLRTGGNSGYQAIHLAAHLGVKRVLLFGFDMHAKNGEHWFGYHSWRIGHKGNYSMFRARFDTLAPELRSRGIEVLNCTLGSALQCFRMASLEEVTENGVRDVWESAESNADSGSQTARETRTGNESAQAGGAA
jgi:hypothetical protein